MGDHPLKGKPSLIHSKFFPPLQGAKGKMSASDETSAIFLTDTPEMIEKKIMNYAFSVGRTTAKEQRELGADLDVDVAYQELVAEHQARRAKVTEEEVLSWMRV